MGGTGDDEQLLVLGVGVGLADEVIAFGFALNHIVVSSLAKVARMGLGAMHHEDGRANLVDVVEEAGVGIGLGADGAPAVVAVAAALVVAARSFSTRTFCECVNECVNV